MSQAGEIYYCEICGAKVRVMEGGEGELVCCQEPMKKVSG
jgi:superoxide reductase